MKHIAKFLIILSIAGCASKSEKLLPQSQILPSVEFPLDGGKTVKVVYTGMPKEIAKLFMGSVSEQRNSFSEYWKAVENPVNSVSVWQSCNNSSCTYGFEVFVPCDGSKTVTFTAEGIYPSMKFSYVSHDQGFHECCFIGVKKQPWWKRIFN
jgi:hypothetical protein